MSPGFYIHNVRYNPAGNPKHFPETNLAHSTGHVAGPDVHYVSRAKLRPAVSQSECEAALSVPVPHVVEFRSKGEVGRVNAGRVVTRVENLLAIRDWSKMDNPTSPARRYQLVVSASSDKPVTSSGRRFPNPAGVRSLHLFPEPARKCFGKSLGREIFFSKFDLHNSVYLSCATFPAGSRQRGDTSNIANGGGPASSKGVF